MSAIDRSLKDQTGNTGFDVFLSHNSKDKPVVRELARALQLHGIKVWLDEAELVPGRPWQEELEEIISTTKSALVMFGPAGLGPWEQPEMRACLSEFVRRNLPVIPVMLPGAPAEPQLPLFLRQLTWVDLRPGLHTPGIERLVWGITGRKVGSDLETQPSANSPWYIPLQKDLTVAPPLSTASPQTQQPMPAIAVSCIISLLAAPAITRAGADFDQALLVWLIYAVTAGAIVNYREGLRAKQLLLYSLPSASVLALVFVYRMIFHEQPMLTGVRLAFDKPQALVLLCVFWMASVIGVWLFSYARGIVLSALKQVTSLSKSRRGQIETTLHWIVRIVGVGYLLIKVFLQTS